MNPAPAPDPAVPIDLPIAERVAAAVKRYGEAEVVDRAVALMGGANAGSDFLLYVGGKHAQGLLAGAPPLYWPELWGARALMHVWNDSAAPAIIAGLDNEAWRVREMSAKVVLMRELDAALKLAALIEDESPRVRSAAVRGLAAVGSAEHVDTIAALVRDPDKDVRRSAQQSRDALRARVSR